MLHVSIQCCIYLIQTINMTMMSYLRSNDLEHIINSLIANNHSWIRDASIEVSAHGCKITNRNIHVISNDINTIKIKIGFEKISVRYSRHLLPLYPNRIKAVYGYRKKRHIYYLVKEIRVEDIGNEEILYHRVNNELTEIIFDKERQLLIDNGINVTDRCRLNKIVSFIFSINHSEKFIIEALNRLSTFIRDHEEYIS